MKPPPESQAAVPILLGARVTHDVPTTRSRPVTLPRPALRLLSDERLARLASAGDRAAFGVIFHRYHRELHRYCVSIVGNTHDAGDALQSTMLRALNALEGDTREIALRPWLHRIAHNESITLLRRPQHAEVDAALAVPAPLDGEESVELRGQLHELLGDLRELPERQRGALVMRELAGLSYAEIAAVLETTQASAKQAAYDARRTLHDLAKGREMDCAAVCTAVSDGDGRTLRRRALRAHLRACADCREFRASIGDRRSKLAALTPGMPSAAASGVLESVLVSAGRGAGGGGLFAGLGVAVQSFTAVAMVAALGAALQVVDRGMGSGSHRGVQVAPIARPNSKPPFPALRAHRAPASHRADPRRAIHSKTGGVPRSGAGRAPAHNPAPSRAPTDAPRPGAPPTTRVTPDPANTEPAARSRRDGPLRHVVTGDSHPIRQGVRIVTHLPAIAGVRNALPGEVPPLPVHPKRTAGRRGKAHRPE
jgi:RNA polymerase sigma factor (sigma-70 family)